MFYIGLIPVVTKIKSIILFSKKNTTSPTLYHCMTQMTSKYSTCQTGNHSDLRCVRRRENGNAIQNELRHLIKPTNQPTNQRTNERTNAIIYPQSESKQARPGQVLITRGAHAWARFSPPSTVQQASNPPTNQPLQSVVMVVPFLARQIIWNPVKEKVLRGEMIFLVLLVFVVCVCVCVLCAVEPESGWTPDGSIWSDGSACVLVVLHLHYLFGFIDVAIYVHVKFGEIRYVL